MKALSIKQPWAWLIVNGIKPVENRSWATKFRGKFLVHASKAPPNAENYLAAKEICEKLGVCLPKINEFDCGGVVGIAEITDSVKEHESPFFFGPNGFVLTNARPCVLKELKGRLSFFESGLEKEDLKWKRKTK